MFLREMDQLFRRPKLSGVRLNFHTFGKPLKLQNIHVTTIYLCDFIFYNIQFHICGALPAGRDSGARKNTLIGFEEARPLRSGRER